MSNINVGKNRNYENVFIRNCVLSVLAILDSQIVLQYIFENNKVKTIHIPFYYGLQNKQYNDSAFGDDIPHEFRLTDKNLESPPVGAIYLNSVSIESDQYTNPNVEVPFTIYNLDKEEHENFLEKVRNIPLVLNFTCSIKLNSENDLFKTTTAIMDVLWSFRTIDFEYLGVIIPLSLEMPDQKNWEINREENGMSAGSTIIKLSFDIDVKVTYPAFRKPYLNNENPSYAKRVKWYSTILGDEKLKNLFNSDE